MPLQQMIGGGLLAIAMVFSAAASIAGDAPIEPALKAFDRGDFVQAAKQLLPLAESGNAVAQHKISILYFYGKGVSEDEKLALEWAKKSAAQGNVDAMYFLGTMLVFGDEAAKLVDDPDREAAKWYFDAARQGHADAEYGLGLMFLAGKGVVQDQAEAEKWIRRAAEHGHAGARSFVGSHPAKVK